MNKEPSVSIFRQNAMLLIFMTNKVTERMLPRGTPFSCLKESDMASVEHF